MRIFIVSVSCCNPAMRSEDQVYLSKVREALAQINVNADVSIVTMNEAISSLGKDRTGEVWSLWKKYGAAIAPAMFIDDKIVLYGGVPTKDRIIEVVAQHSGREIV
jgi:predicted RNA-binding protein with PUA domain